MHLTTVLVIDEDPNILKAFEDFFKREGIRMIGSSRNSEAKKILMASRIDLIIMDVSPLHKSKSNFLMKTKQQYPEIPIIGLSPFKDFLNDPSLVTEEIALFIPKPVDIQKLRDAINSLLNNCSDSAAENIEKKIEVRNYSQGNSMKFKCNKSFNSLINNSLMISMQRR